MTKRASRYVCNTLVRGPASRVSEYSARDGDKEVTVVTRWQDIKCGHISSAHDPECTGCEYRRAE